MTRETVIRFSLAILSLLAACSVPKPVAAPVVPTSVATVVRKIAVIPFEGPSGALMSNELVRQLVNSEFKIVDPSMHPDAVLTGQMADYRPLTKQLVYLGNVAVPVADGKSVTVTHPVLSNSTTPLIPEGTMSSPHAPMVAVNAVVGALAKLTDVKSNRVLWAYGFTYEALDTESAGRVVAAVLAKSMRQAVKPLNPAGAKAK